MPRRTAVAIPRPFPQAIESYCASIARRECLTNVGVVIRVTLALIALAAVVPASAQATFAGSNGAIAFAQRTTSGDQVDPAVEHTRIVTRRATGTANRTLVD